MKTTSVRQWIRVLAIATVAVPLAVWAGKDNKKTYEPKAEIGQWRQTLSERVVKEIRVKVVRTQGSARETFLNAAFGDGLAFENARRAYLTSDKDMEISWKVDAAPNGKELRILCHHGKCTLKSVTVLY